MAATQAVTGHGGNFVRTAELQRILAQLALLDHGNGRIIELAGEPGTGKTRLLGELIKEAQRREVAVLTGRCTEMEQTAPLQVFRQVLGQEPGTHTDNELTPLWDAIDQVPCSDVEPCSDADQARLLSRARSMLVSRVRNRTILMLDDFHWASAESRMLVDYLVRWPIDAPILLVIAQRPRQASPHLRGTLAHGAELGTVERIDLHPLTLRQSAHLLGLDDDVPALQNLFLHGDGIPAYMLVLADAENCKRAPAGARLPPWFSALFSSELAGLSARESRMAAAAAVLGDVCDIEALAFVADESIEGACEIVGSMVRRDLLRPIRDTLSFSLRHPLLRSMIYVETQPSRRIRFQQRALQVLADRGASISELACYLDLSSTWSGHVDLQIFVRTADRSIRSEPMVTARWLQSLLRELPDRHGPQHTELKFHLARALGVTGRLEESRNILHEILTVAPVERGLRSSAMAFCAIIECLLGNYAEARALLDTGISNASENADPEMITLLIERGLIGALDNDVPDRERCELILTMAREKNDSLAEAAALSLYGLSLALYSDAPGDTSLMAGSSLIIDGLSDEDVAPHPEYIGLLGWAETLTGRFADSERHFARAVAIARRLGHGHLLPILLTGLSNARRHLGQLDGARVAAAEAVQAARAMNVRHVEGLALATQSLTMIWTDQAEEKQTIELAEAAAKALRTSAFGWNFCGAIVLASIRMLSGQPEDCSPLILDAGGGPHLPRIPVLLRPMCYELLAAAAAKAKKPIDVWADFAQAAAEECGVIAQRGYALVARANALETAEEYEAATHMYSEASDAFRSVDMPITQARALLSAAQAAIAAKHPEAASTTIAVVRDLAQQCGSKRIYGHIQDERREDGVCEQGLSILTNREGEIAVMASAGKRTREIAAELSLSPRTVDVHLTRIYRKLGVSSRAALAHLLAQQ